MYGLFDTVAPDAIRYIGATTSSGYMRRHQIWHQATRSSPSTQNKLHLWVASLGEKSRLGFRVLATLDSATAVFEAEKDFIQDAWEVGSADCNDHEGGRTGWTHSDRTRKQLSEKSAGHTLPDQVRKRLSEQGMDRGPVNWEMVRYIRDPDRPWASDKTLGQELGIAPMTVARIRRGLRWNLED